MNNRNGARLKEEITLILVFFLLISVIFISGCVQQPQPAIKSEREVGEAVTNISSDVESVTETLQDIDTKLG